MTFSWLPLELTYPLFLLGLLVLPILGWYYLRGLTDFAKWQRLLSLAVRAAVVTLLVLALSGLTLLSPTREQFVVFAIDESQSVGEELPPGDPLRPIRGFELKNDIPVFDLATRIVSGQGQVVAVIVADALYGKAAQQGLPLYEIGAQIRDHVFARSPLLLGCRPVTGQASPPSLEWSP